MVRVVVADDLIVDRRHANGLQVRELLTAMVQQPVVEQHGLAGGCDENGAITLADVHEMDLEPVRLRRGHRLQRTDRQRD